MGYRENPYVHEISRLCYAPLEIRGGVAFGMTLGLCHDEWMQARVDRETPYPRSLIAFSPNIAYNNIRKKNYPEAFIYEIFSAFSKWQ